MPFRNFQNLRLILRSTLFSCHAFSPRLSLLVYFSGFYVDYTIQIVITFPNLKCDSTAYP